MAPRAKISQIPANEAEPLIFRPTLGDPEANLLGWALQYPDSGIIEQIHAAAAGGVTIEQIFPASAPLLRAVFRAHNEGTSASFDSIANIIGGDNTDAARRARETAATEGCAIDGPALRAIAQAAAYVAEAEVLRQAPAAIRALVQSHHKRERVATAASFLDACTEDGADVSVLLEKAVEINRRLGSVDGGSETPIYNSADFVAGFTPPDYLLGGVLQLGNIYSFTGGTGAGKTAVVLRLLAHIGTGTEFAGREVTKGRALMLVGENPDDVRARWIALAEHMNFSASLADVDFMPGVFSIADNVSRIEEQAERVGGYSLVCVDTVAAYFQGDEENSNKQLGDHARLLRTLTRLPGKPCVLTPAHPVKGENGSLVPRGGGAFLAEMDGNLTCQRTEGSVQVHWLGKFRGPEFDAMAFDLLTVTSNKLTDSKGRHIPTVIAVPLSDVEQQERADATADDVRTLMSVMATNPGAPMSALAEKAGWFFATGKPNKSKVQRLVLDLRAGRYTEKTGNTWTLTQSGKKAAKDRPNVL
jgi:hypothetical protein